MNTVRLGQLLDSNDLDAVVLATAENIVWATGIESVPLRMFPHTGYSCVVLSRASLKSGVFVSSACEVDQALDSELPLTDVIAYGTFYREQGRDASRSARDDLLAEMSPVVPRASSPTDALVQALRSLGVANGRVGIDAASERTAMIGELADRLPSVVMIDASQVIREARKTKTAAEISRLTQAARAAESGIKAAIAAMAVGVTERQLVEEYEVAVTRLGARPNFSLIKIGEDAVAGQTRPSSRRLSPGDSVWFDVGLVLNGYWADIARVASLGEPRADVTRAYAAVLNGEQVGIEQARPGMTGGQLFNVVVDAVRQSGLPHYRRQHVGHGIGVEVYDRVLLTPGNEDVLEDGCVVNIETPYYLFGMGAVHVEDPFVLNTTGNALLTTLDRELHIVSI